MAVEKLLLMNSRGPQICEEDVLRFEQTLVGKRLPDDYREFLLSINGGRTSLDQRVFTIERDTTILHSFYGIRHPIDDIQEHREFLLHNDEHFPRELLVIGYDDGGSRICLAIDGVKRGEIWFNDLLDPREPKLFLEWYERKRDFVKIAGSFTDFIKMLQPTPRRAKQREQ